MTTKTKARNTLLPGPKPAKPILRPGSPVCLCQGCGDYFSGPAVFDKHLVGLEDTRCRTHKERIKAGMVQNEYGVWQKGGKAQG